MGSGPDLPYGRSGICRGPRALGPRAFAFWCRTVGRYFSFLKKVRNRWTNFFVPQFEYYYIVSLSRVMKELAHCRTLYHFARIYLCLMMSNCSCGRSFSKLRVIKNKFRSLMTQTRLNNLTLLSIEHRVLRDIDLPTLIHNFALVKFCKHNF